MKSANPSFQPDVFTWVCVSLVVLPTVVSLIAAIALSCSPEGMVGFAGLGSGFILLLSGPILVAEYLAILRCNVRAAGLMAGALLYFSLLGVVGLLFNLAELLRLQSAPKPHRISLAEFAILSAFVALIVLISLGHLRWHRRLKSAAIAGSKKRVINEV